VIGGILPSRPVTAAGTPGASTYVGACVFLLSGLDITYSSTSIAIDGGGTCVGTGGGTVTIHLSGTPVLGCQSDVISMGGTVDLSIPGQDSVTALFTGNVAVMHLLITGAHLKASAILVGTYVFSPANCVLRQTGAGNLAGAMVYIWT
jgi:hypothetical protein